MLRIIILTQCAAKQLSNSGVVSGCEAHSASRLPLRLGSTSLKLAAPAVIHGEWVHRHIIISLCELSAGSGWCLKLGLQSI
jgi:hypothetical protein